MHQLSEERYKQMLACEALIRRVAHLKIPLMLKGSYLTRQYFADPFMRYANDVDWVSMEHLESATKARETLNAWFIAITELDLNDGVSFRSFRENAFWRQIDYAMSDDFPTVNTDLICTIDGVEYHWDSLDVSFNIAIVPAPVSLLYTPLQGDAFLIPYTAPLSLQVAWKLHQCIVNLRCKDVWDLIHLLQHTQFNAECRAEALQALVNECHVDGINIRKILPFIRNTHVDKYNHPSELVDISPDIDVSELSITSLLARFSLALQQAEITAATMKSIPAPTQQYRPGSILYGGYIPPDSQEYRYLVREKQAHDRLRRTFPTPWHLLSSTERTALLLLFGVLLFICVYHYLH